MVSEGPTTRWLREVFAWETVIMNHTSRGGNRLQYVHRIPLSFPLRFCGADISAFCLRPKIAILSFTEPLTFIPGFCQIAEIRISKSENTKYTYTQR